jgi:chemotaxis signal transduction protein
MALSHKMDKKNTGKSDSRRQIFTFFVEDMMFGVGIENVLMLGQDVNTIQRLPLEERGFCGITKLEGVIVPVLDFAHRIGIPSGMDSKNELINLLTKFENDQIDWVLKLENAVKNGANFMEQTQTNPQLSEFGKWYSQLETRDETLKELVQEFIKPHEELYGLVRVLIQFENDVEGGLDFLQKEKQKSLKRLRSLFSRAREQIHSGMRPVLLFLTTDGKTPRYALLIDDINDVLNFQPSDYQASNQGGMSLLGKIEQVINGIYTRDGGPDCLYFDIEKLTDIDQLMDKVS